MAFDRVNLSVTARPNDDIAAPDGVPRIFGRAQDAPPPAIRVVNLTLEWLFREESARTPVILDIPIVWVTRPNMGVARGRADQR